MAKGSYDIDKLTDTKDIINKIINQTNSLNKKIKAFNKNDIIEHGEMINHLLGDGSVVFNDTGSKKKKKKFYDGQNILELKRTLSALHKMNNHEFYGTIKKYEKEMNDRMYGVQQKVKNYLQEKGYSDEFINGVIHDKGFFVQLFLAFQDGKKGADSKSVIEKISLNYNPNESGLTDKEMNRILNNIENSANMQKSIKKKKKALNEFKNFNRSNPVR